MLFMAMVLLWPFLCSARQVHDTLYINRGTFTTIKNTTFPALAFNRSRTFDKTSAVIALRIGDTLTLSVINNDTALHAFSLKPADIGFTIIRPDSSYSVKVVPHDPGAYCYSDPMFYPANAYMGLAGMLAVLPADSVTSFFWNIQEHEQSYNMAIAQGLTVDWSRYDPDYFTINGRSYPQIDSDVTAKIRAKVGEKVHIFIANTGQSMHALHFHGFHCKVLASTNYNISDGWIKDSFPLKKMSGLLLELIPDKPGKYSVHDHNLVAVSAGGTHPNGMFTIMEIQ